MNETDPWLTRLIAGTVCALAVIFAVTACWQVLEGYEADKNIHDLLYLIVGGLLSQVTTHVIQKVRDGMQNIQVPAPLLPDDALTAPAVPLSNPSDAAPAPHPDAPEESDL